MPLVTTQKMFKKAYENGYAIGAFNVNNMEIIQGIVEAATEENAPLILQVSSGARKYATPSICARWSKLPKKSAIFPSACTLITATRSNCARAASTADSTPS